ncbi:MAG TPA: LOG family protein [Planctomycetota bacterium]|nr:LOG family protein [Planctomycetota bacterium]
MAKSTPQKSARTLRKELPAATAPDRATLPPQGGPTPGAMGAGPGATTDEAHTDGSAVADIHALPLRPETVTPTSPTPTKKELIAAGAPPQVVKKIKRRPPPVFKPATPVPSIELLEEKVRDLIALQGEHPDQDLVGDMIITTLKMMRDGSTRGELKILASTLRELRYAFNIFRPFQNKRKITVFGSARTPKTAPEYKQAQAFSEEMVRRNFMVITGAGPGIMEAANGGAGRDYSFGVNIKLPFEQSANPYIEGDKKLIHFRYFFTRKLCFVKEASAIALFPGGFGTHDECFETLTLVQTGKASMIPIVFIDQKGGEYWREWADYVVEHLLGKGLISEEDMHLFKITDDATWAADEVTNFYKRYHSSRFVKDTLVIRMLSKLTKENIDELNTRFSSLTTNGKGRIVETKPLPEEASEPELLELPRIAFPFNRRNYGRLRLLIDQINRF